MNIYNNDIEPIKIIEEDKYIVFLIKLLKKTNLENLFIERFISNIKSGNIAVDGIVSLNDTTPLKLEFVDDKGTLLIITKNYKYSDIYQYYIEELYELRNIKEIFWIFLNKSHVNIKHFNKNFGCCEDISISDWEVIDG